MDGQHAWRGSCPEVSFMQEELWPGLVLKVPPWLRRLRYGVLRYFEEHPTAWRAPTHRQISASLEKDVQNGWFSVASVDRFFRQARQECPELWPWPQHRGMRLTWEIEPANGIADPEPVVLQSADQLELPLRDGRIGLFQLDGAGVPHLRNILSLAATTALTAYSVLDGMDGHHDMVIHWCHVFIQYGFGHL